ncbi:MAG: hypothetical protein FJ098_09180 [Deltaproteobacteria bacterium]|nr:hypothetical protein [Deltaproteobacteria bacterium]
MIPLHVRCGHCGKGLLDPSRPLDGQPSVRVLLGTRRGEHELFLSCLYGSFRFDTRAPVDPDEVTGFRCPHCGRSLVTRETCTICAAPLASLDLDEGGSVQFCSRRGCKGHRLLMDDPTQLLDGFAPAR